jgi:hypothetical protein
MVCGLKHLQAGLNEGIFFEELLIVQLINGVIDDFNLFEDKAIHLPKSLFLFDQIFANLFSELLKSPRFCTPRCL